MSSAATNIVLQQNFVERLNQDLKEIHEGTFDLSEHVVMSYLIDIEAEFTLAKERHKKIIFSKSVEVTKYTEEDYFRQVRTSYHKLWGALHAALPKAAPKQEEPSMHSTMMQSSCQFHPKGFKLPKVDLPIYEGGYEGWMNYINLFDVLVHNNTSLEPLHKFEYFKTTLRGEPYLLIKNLPMTDESYFEARDILRKRFQHTRKIVNTYFDRLFKPKMIQSESSKSIKNVVDTINDCTASLKKFDIDVPDYVIIFHFEEVLPNEVIKDWQTSLGATTDLPTLKRFLEFLDTRFRTLEFTESLSKNHRKHEKVFHVQTVKHKENKNKPSFSKTHPKEAKYHNTKCLVCKKDHPFYKCDEYTKMPQDVRLSFVKRAKLCVNCLQNTHSTKQCTSKFVCRVCSRSHHTTLHRYEVHQRQNNAVPNNPVTHVAESNNAQSSNAATVPANRNFHIHSASKLLGTARVKAFNQYGFSILVRALVDPCSTDNYITSATANSLNLKKYYDPTEVLTMGNSEPNQCSYRVNIRIKSLHGNFSTTISAAIVDNITTDMPSTEIPLPTFGSLADLPLGDSFFNRPSSINVLLGVDVHTLIKLDGTKRHGQLIAENTLLGYLIRGSANEGSSNLRRSTVLLTQSSTHDLQKQIQKFWETEELIASKPQDPEEILCEEIFQKSITKNESNQLSVDLPFKHNSTPIIGSSRFMATRRFLTMEKKLESNASLKAEYHKQIQEYIDCKHMIKADEQPDLGKEFYLPHHAVIKESSSTTKVRVVFDASCKSSDGTSLNDHLMTGPKLQKDIRDILFLWRQFPFPLTADVEKMYRMFGVNPSHQDYQRIVWRFSPDEPLQNYKLTTITFGTSSAPYQAIRLLNYIADESQQSYPLASSAIKSNFYVDDCITGGYTIEETITLKNQLLEALKAYGLNLRKWSSSCPDVLKDMSPNLLDPSHELIFDETQFSKTLGVCWSKSQDSFLFHIDLSKYSQNKLTKREILSLIARLYDPLGFVSPCTMLSKQIMQGIWQTSTGWDEVVDAQIQSEFADFLRELHLLRNINIPRWINISDATSELTLVGFCDASMKGYEAVIYLLNPKPESSTGNLILLSSKTKVADLKYVSIARLELNGAVLLAELLHWAKELFKPRQCKIHAFCDSQIVLAWLQTNPAKWKTYVANRATQILNLISKENWFYVDTKNNPADLASRGLLPSEIVSNHMWWFGPDLKNLKFETDVRLNSEEEKLVNEAANRKSIVLQVTSEQTTFLTKYSNHSLMRRKVKALIAFPLNILKKILSKNLSSTATTVITNSQQLLSPIVEHSTTRIDTNSNFSYSNKQESTSSTACKVNNKNQHYLELVQRLQYPDNVIFRLIQKAVYADDIKSITKNISLPKESTIRGLFPFLDKYGVLRVGGRLHNADLSYNEKHPIILPGKHQVTTNIIQEAHQLTLHGNENSMLAYLRNRCHIPRISDKVKHYIHNCNTCYRFAKREQKQLMGSLPKPRVQLERAFFNAGVDYAGPMTIKAYPGKCKKFLKAYIAVFVCLGSKALHLELVSDLSSNAFLAAFKRFTFRRGRCQDLYSDNGTNFIGAARLLNENLIKAEKTWKSELKIDFENMGTTWHFIPPATPHFGGLWEAGVKSVKTHLKKTIGTSILTFEELSTILVQIEGVLNSRPLCAMSNNPNDYNVLTPAHFLIGEPIVAPVEEAYDTEGKSPLNRWNHVQFTFQRFVRLWKRDYLQTLQNRPKNQSEKRDLCVNDLVLLADDNMPSTIWPTVIIEKIHPGSDGRVRVVTVRSSNGKCFQRPITKLRYLPCNNARDDSPSTARSC